MSVLIKDITFPRKPDQITVIFRFNDPIGDFTHTHYIAPDEIVEVPPHGKLIDQKELIKAINKKVDNVSENRGRGATIPSIAWFSGMSSALSIIENAPTIIESEENGSLSTTFQQPFKAFQKPIKDKKNESGTGGCVKDSERFITVKVPKTPTYTTTMLVDITTESTNKIAEAVVEKLCNCGVKMNLECKDESD